MKNKLNPRLLSAAEFVRQGARFADIGTDHAYLPIFLLSEGRISFAVCSDINEGPLSVAKINAEAEGLTDKMAFTLADGADALSEYEIGDFAICGMGGELISSIVQRSELFRTDTVRLVLQPMTKQEMLRERLYLSGYEIEAESYSAEGDKIYVCMCVRYTGIKKQLSEREMEICPDGAEIVNKSIQIAYLNRKRAIYEKIVDGKKQGGEDSSREQAIVAMIEKYIKGETGK